MEQADAQLPPPSPSPPPPSPPPPPAPPLSPLPAGAFGNRAGLAAAISEWFADATAAEAARGPLPTWDVSRVDDLTDLFKGRPWFNRNISRWDTSSVTSFRGTFYRAESFNGDLSRWDTAKSTSFRSTFWAAETFMRGVSRWDTAKSTTFYGTFSGASGFHGDVSRWDTASATTFSKCFHLAENFQGDISKWDTSRATHDDAAFFELKRENVAAKNRSRSAAVCTSRAPPSATAGHEFGMAQRASRWRQCVADRGKSKESVRPGDYVAVDVCRPARCGYIHVFKSGSQTVGEAFRTACAMAFGEAVEAGGTKPSAVDIAPSTVSTQCSPKLRGSMGCHGPINWANCNVSFFTVVRDPMERWPSGVYEVARREPAGWPASLYERAHEGLAGDELARAVFELQPRANPHLQPQTNFVLGPAGAVVPQLDFVARLEHIDVEWPALMARCFGRPWTLGELLPGAANTGAGRSHQRDRNSDEYLRTNDRAKLFANLSAAAVRPQLEQLYATDLKCLGYTISAGR